VKWGYCASSRPLLLASASFLSFAFGLQPLCPLQNFVLDFCLQVHEIPVIAGVFSLFGKSLRNVGVIIAHCSCVSSAQYIAQWARIPDS